MGIMCEAQSLFLVFSMLSYAKQKKGNNMFDLLQHIEEDPVFRMITCNELIHTYLHNFAVHNGANGASAKPWTKSFEEPHFPINLYDVLC